MMTDAIHAAFRSRIQSSQAISTCCVATLFGPADMKHMAVNFVPQVEADVIPLSAIVLRRGRRSPLTFVLPV